MNDKKIRTVKVLVFLIVGFLMLLLNILTQLWADDFSLTYIFGTTEKLRSIKDVITSQLNLYLTWGGRNVAHALTQIFLLIGKPVFNVINTIVYLLFIYLIYLHSNFGKKDNILWLFLIHFFLWTQLPAFGQSILMLTGSCNYLWGITIVLLFLLPYRIYLTQKTIFLNNKKIMGCIIMFILGLIAGWTNENTGAAIVISLLIGNVYLIKKRKRIEFWMYAGEFGSILGFIIMIAAPGNYIRAEVAGMTGRTLWDKIGHLFVNIVKYTANYFEYFAGLVIFGGFCFGIYFFVLKNKTQIIKRILLSYGFLLFICIYSMIVVYDFPPRGWSSPCAFSLILIGNIFTEIDFCKVNVNFNRLRKYAFYLCFTTFLFSYVLAFKDAVKVTIAAKEREAYIQEEKAKGNMDINCEIINFTNKHGCDIGDISTNQDYWINQSVAFYYGVDYITGFTIN